MTASTAPSDGFAACVAKAKAKLDAKPLSVTMRNERQTLHQLLDQLVNQLFNSPANCEPPDTGGAGF